MHALSWVGHTHQASFNGRGMGTFGRVVVLSSGALGGMWLGFYLKENYYLKQNKERRDELIGELQRLRTLRKTKEERLKALVNANNASKTS